MKKLLLAIMSIYMEKKRNLWVIPTEKPSRLYEFGGQFHIEASLQENFRSYNIYITSDEEIKEGVDQWYLDKVLNKPYNSGGAQYSSNQDVIILTTDPDLIKNGIQAIDDTFLEWFIKNPSCEEVEVETTRERNGYHSKHKKRYKIIIPQEKPKTYSCCGRCNGVDDICILDREEAKQRAANYMRLKGALEVKEEPLEEADKWSLEKAEEFALERFKSDHKKGIVTWDLILEVLKVGVKTGHKFGSKWQQEQDKIMYSELSIYLQELADKDRLKSLTSNQIRTAIEQFKKK
jgi:hypothetical protein